MTDQDKQVDLVLENADLREELASLLQRIGLLTDQVDELATQAVTADEVVRQMVEGKSHDEEEARMRLGIALSLMDDEQRVKYRAECDRRITVRDEMAGIEGGFKMGGEK